MKPIHFVLVLFAITICVSQINAQWVQTKRPDYVGAQVMSVGSIGSTVLSCVNASDGGRLMRFRPNDSSWVELRNRTYVLCYLADGANLFAGTATEGVLLSTDYGESWKSVNVGLTDISYARALTIAGERLFVSWGADYDVVGAGWSEDRGVFLSTDYGTTWTAANQGLPRLPEDSTTFLGISSLLADGQNLFAGTWGDGVYLSTNNGISWAEMNTGFTDSIVYPLAVVGTNLLAGTSGNYGYGGPGGVFMSTDHGASWTRTGFEWNHGAVRHFAVSGTNVFAGTLSGVFLSTDYGVSWSEVDSGMTDSLITGLCICGSDLFAATLGAGVWMRPLSEMITAVDPIGGELPRELMLHQNYPNPFNPSTMLRYGVPERSTVRLAVYNTLGQQVALVEAGEVGAGYHEKTFDASSLTSGVYFYKLEATSMVTGKMFTDTRKMVLMR